MRDRLAMTAATAMIGTACFGPYSYTRTGISMIDEPVPTMPEMVPAIRPTARTKRKFKAFVLRESRPGIPVPGLSPEKQRTKPGRRAGTGLDVHAPGIMAAAGLESPPGLDGWKFAPYGV